MPLQSAMAVTIRAAIHAKAVAPADAKHHARPTAVDTHAQAVAEDIVTMSAKTPVIMIVPVPASANLN